MVFLARALDLVHCRSGAKYERTTIARKRELEEDLKGIQTMT